MSLFDHVGGLPPYPPDEMTLERVGRLRDMLFLTLAFHLRECLLCKMRFECHDKEHLCERLCYYSHLAMKAEWQAFDQESEEGV